MKTKLRLSNLKKHIRIDHVHQHHATNYISKTFYLFPTGDSLKCLVQSSVYEDAVVHICPSFASSCCKLAYRSKNKFNTQSNLCKRPPLGPKNSAYTINLWPGTILSKLLSQNRVVNEFGLCIFILFFF